MYMDRRASRACALLCLAAVACASREVPSTWPEASAAAPASPEAPVAAVTRALEGPPPLPGEASEGWSGLEATEGERSAPSSGAPSGHGEHGSHAEHAAPPPAPALDAEPAGSDAVVYTCPMHPDVVSDKPGKCPRCGMTLVKRNGEK
jgi:heavy metal-binding protein